MMGVEDLVASAPAPGLHLKPALPANVGPKGRDSTYAFQGLGWPWARTADGRDLFTGIRLSTITDGSCYYHAVYKAVGTLRRLTTLTGGEDSPAPFFTDEAFVASLDYLDVDYRDPESLFSYIRLKNPEAKYMVDTYTHRQFLVDTWRNDIFRWFLRPAINSDTEEYYTEEEAIIALNNDVRNMRMWLKAEALNPNVVKITTTNAEASRFLDLLLGGDAPIVKELPRAERKMVLPDIYAVYTALIGLNVTTITEQRLNSPAIANIQGYITNTVVNSTATDRMENATLVARQLGRLDPIGEGMVEALYDNTEAALLVGRILEQKGKGLINAVIRCLDVIARSTFYDEVLKAYTVKITGKEMMDALAGTDFHAEMASLIKQDVVNELKIGNPSWFLERLDEYIKTNAAKLITIYTPDDAAKMQDIWMAKLTTIGPERLPDLNVLIDEEVKARMGPSAIRDKALYFFNQQDWGVLAPLVADEKQTPAQVLVFIDKMLDQPDTVGYTVKQLFRSRLTGSYLRAIEEYIDTRFTLITLIKAECGFNYNMFTYQPYPTTRLENFVTSPDQGWALLASSINSATQRQYTSAEVDALKFRDPRTIVVDGYPLACKFVDLGGFHERTPELDDELMALSLNLNYFMADGGFHLRAQVYESSLESIQYMVPVTRGRRDAGEDILPWMSRLLSCNVHVVHCYGMSYDNLALGLNHRFIRDTDIVWLYRSYVSEDLDTEAPGSPHIFINNCGGHYETFGIIKTVSHPPRRDDIVTFFNSDDAFVAAFRQFIPNTTVAGVRLNVETAYGQLAVRPLIPTPIVPVAITSLLVGTEDALELQLRARALTPHMERELPSPSNIEPKLPQVTLPRGFAISPFEDIPSSGQLNTSQTTIFGKTLPLPLPPGEFGDD